MTVEERQAVLKAREKKVTNQAVKGKMKFMQKYYHRGAFFMDEEEDIYKRDTTGATLEDHFDKSVMPEVMQVRCTGSSTVFEPMRRNLDKIMRDVSRMG